MTTPNLQKLAEMGAFNFTTAYSPAGITLQSIASLHTLSLPFAAGLDLWSAPWRGRLRPDAVTLAETLRADGYRTWMVTHNIHDAFRTYQLGLNQGFSDVGYVGRADVPRGSAKRADVDSVIAERSIAKLEQMTTGEPFFGWIFFESPHDAYVSHYDELPADTEEQRYAQELRYMDEQFGRVLDRLQSTRLLENTIVVFMADHGEELRERGGIGHITLYDECTHVPLLVRLPGVTGERISTSTSTAFALPWLMAHMPGNTGRLAQARIDSFFLPLLKATKGSAAMELLGPDLATVALAGRDGTKTICHLSSRWCELYDLRRDPGERTDLSLHDSSLSQLERFESYERFRLQNANYRFVDEPNTAFSSFFRSQQ